MAQERKTYNYPSQCTLCPFLGDPDEVVQHHLETHLTADRIPFACKDCHFKTFTRGKARKHRVEKHGGSESENVDDVFLGIKTNMDPSKLRTLKTVNRRETYKMTWDNPTGYKSAQVCRYGDIPWRNNWYKGRTFRQQGYRSSSPYRRKRFNDYPRRAFRNLEIHTGGSDEW